MAASTAGKRSHYVFLVNDDESGLHQDYEAWLEGLAPHEPVSRYRHNRTGEDNGDAHLKRQVMGRGVVVAITGGRLDFGLWEQILSELDGGRRKQVLVKALWLLTLSRPGSIPYERSWGVNAKTLDA